MMLALALGWAEVIGAGDIFIGVTAVDYSGYPDCRPEFIAAFEQLARLATKAGVEGGRFEIHAPLSRCRRQRSCAPGWPRGGSTDDGVLLPGERGGAGLRAVRFVPAAGGGICRGRGCGSDALSVGLEKWPSCRIETFLLLPCFVH